MEKYALKTIFGDKLRVEYHAQNSSYIEHEHNYAELIIAVSGRATHIINGQNYPVRMGDVFIINPGTIHALRNASTLKECLVQYSSQLLEILGAEVRLMSAFYTLFLFAPRYPAANYKCRLQLSASDLEHALEICSRMENELHTRNEGFSAMLQALFGELVVFLCRKYDQPRQPDAISRTILQISKVTSYIESSFDKKLTLDDLAKKGNISRRHFTRIFRQIHGISPLEYIIQLRIKRAAIMLQNTGYNVTEVAFLCGFEDSNYFSRQFRKILGVSPLKYRALSESPMRAIAAIS